LNLVENHDLGSLNHIIFVETAAGYERSTLYALRARFRNDIATTLLGEGAAGSPANVYGMTSELFGRFRGDGAVELASLLADSIGSVTEVSCPSDTCWMVVDRGMVSIEIVAPNGQVTGRGGMWERVVLEVFTADTGSYGLWVNMPITGERRWPESARPASFISVDNSDAFNEFRARMMAHIQMRLPNLTSPG
jgi:hypothetical protein